MHGNFNALLRTAASALLAAGIAACGGGGGGDSGTTPSTPVAPTTPVAVTATNADKAAAAAISGVTAVGGGSSLYAAETVVTPVPPRSLSRISSDAVRRAHLLLSSPQSIAAAVSSYPFNCAISGTGTLTLTTSDSTGALTAVGFAFSNCSDIAGEVLNGSMSISVTTDTATTFSGTFSADLTLTATGYPTVRMVGGYTFTQNYTGSDWTGTVSGTSFSLYEGSTVHTLTNFSFSDSYAFATDTYTHIANFTLASTDLGGQVTVATSGATPIRQLGYRMFPYQGIVTVTGTGGSKLRITINGDETYTVGFDVTIEVDANGDNVYETTLNREWSALMA